MARIGPIATLALTALSLGSANAQTNGTHCWSDAREANALRWLRLVLSSLSPYDTADGIRELSADADNTTLLIDGIGIYIGFGQVLEYILLTRPDYNEGVVEFLERHITGYECLDEDIVQVFTQARVSFNGADSEMIEQMDNLTFVGDRILFDHTDSGAFGDAIASSGLDAKSLCDAALIPCTGGLFPFASLQECYEIMSTIPQACEDGSGPLVGDTVSCRFLHVGSSFFDGLYHCPHIGSDSTECLPSSCPGNPPRLAEPSLPSYFDASLPRPVLIIEWTLFGLLLAIALAFYVHWCRQSASQHIKTGVELALSAVPKRSDKVLSAQLESVRGRLPVALYQLSNLNVFLGAKMSKHRRRVLSCNDLTLGGCRLTAIMGESGSGKTTLLRLISGFEGLDGYMHMSTSGAAGSPTMYCPQSADMWPSEMQVQDILLFSAQLGGTRVSVFVEIFAALGIIDVMGQTFGSLSGGQRQRVSIAACLMRPVPTVIILDEPLAALDSASAIKCLQALKALPGSHSFVITVHQPSSEVAALFDRVLLLDTLKDHQIKELKDPTRAWDSDIWTATNNLVTGLPPSVRGIQVAQPSIASKGSVFHTYQSLVTLWFSALYRAPWIEASAIGLGLLGSLLVGLMSRDSLNVDKISTATAIRAATYVTMAIAGLAFSASVVVAFFFESRESRLIEHLKYQGYIHPIGFVTFHLHRVLVLSILQSAAWMPLMQYLTVALMPEAYIQDIILTVAIFCAMWMMLSVLIHMASPRAINVTVLMLINTFCLFTCGIFFPWNSLNGFFRLLHYVTPLFYVSTSSNILTYSEFNAGCGPLDHPGTCASNLELKDLLELQDISTLGAQGVCALYGLVFALCLYLGAHPHLRAMLFSSTCGIFMKTEEMMAAADDIPMAAADDIPMKVKDVRNLEWASTYKTVTLDELSTKLAARSSCRSSCSGTSPSSPSVAAKRAVKHVAVDGTVAMQQCSTIAETASAV